MVEEGPRSHVQKYIQIQNYFQNVHEKKERYKSQHREVKCKL